MLEAIFAMVDDLLKKPAPAPAPSFIPSPAVPPGLTLRHTYLTSQSGLTFPVEWVYFVGVGGGGSGAGKYGAAGAGGGGGAACIQGWMRSSILTSVTIGAGGPSVAVPSSSNVNGRDGYPTIIANLITIPGGMAGLSSATTAEGRDGVGIGGNITDTSKQFPLFGFFKGGRSVSDVATSGAGAGANMNKGGNGYGGPAGGGSPRDYIASLAQANGGDCYSPGGTLYLGGKPPATNVYWHGAGGGAGILGNGTPGSLDVGGAGGLGGGGGGASAPAYASNQLTGKGGDGAVLIYY